MTGELGKYGFITNLYIKTENEIHLHSIENFISKVLDNPKSLVGTLSLANGLVPIKNQSELYKSFIFPPFIFITSYESILFINRRKNNLISNSL